MSMIKSSLDSSPLSELLIGVARTRTEDNVMQTHCTTNYTTTPLSVRPSC